jgi:glutathione S-transferase
MKRDSPDAIKHFQDLVKRTLGTVDAGLEGKKYLVGGKCTIADLAYVPWDLMLDRKQRRFTQRFNIVSNVSDSLFERGRGSRNQGVERKEVPQLGSMAC